MRPGERSGAVTAAPQVEIFINQRAGTVGTSLATGILQPALAVASRQIGRHLAPLVPAGWPAPATRLLLADPVAVTIVQYRPLPNNAGLGLTPFYIALLTLLCGFIGGGIVNSVVDSALGYASTDLGPRWRQRQPVPINRWQTLLVKWGVIAVATAVLTAVMLLVAWGVGMDMPWPWLLWVFTWLCALSVGIGTIALFAMAGNYGQLIGLLIFVYAGLASAGGTVPVEALPGFLRTLSYVEPLRQVIEGTRSILYFNAQGVAGLTRGTVAAAAGLVFWLVVGGFVVRWYDRKGFYRLRPEVLAHVDKAVKDYRTKQSAPAPAPSDAPASRPPARPSPSGPQRRQGRRADAACPDPRGACPDGHGGSDAPGQQDGGIRASATAKGTSHDLIHRRRSDPGHPPGGRRDRTRPGGRAAAAFPPLAPRLPVRHAAGAATRPGARSRAALRRRDVPRSRPDRQVPDQGSALRGRRRRPGPRVPGRPRDQRR